MRVKDLVTETISHFVRSSFAVKNIFLLKNFSILPHAVAFRPCEVRFAHFSPHSNPNESQAVVFLTLRKIKKHKSSSFVFFNFAEGEGFEPSNRLPSCYLSKVVH